MQITTILFDLDGTLLPMDMDVFIHGYFKALAQKLAPYGYAPQALIDAVWKGTDAMIGNNGPRTNEEVFWEVFTARFPECTEEDKAVFDDFYRNEFQSVQSLCGFEPQAALTVKKIKDAGYRVALATNPVFPAVATQSRIRWAGLSPEDFALYTTYENVTHSKPNPLYYAEVAASLNVLPEECLMVGNDTTDDMIARSIGMQVFLLTDNLINKKGEDISQYPRGGYDELLAHLSL